jgi:hypothetical protein
VYENRKMRPAETTPGMRENDRGGEFKYDKFIVRTFKMSQCTPHSNNDMITKM